MKKVLYSENRNLGVQEDMQSQMQISIKTSSCVPFSISSNKSIYFGAFSIMGMQMMVNDEIRVGFEVSRFGIGLNKLKTLN